MRSPCSSECKDQKNIKFVLLLVCSSHVLLTFRLYMSTVVQDAKEIAIKRGDESVYFDKVGYNKLCYLRRSLTFKYIDVEQYLAL